MFLHGVHHQANLRDLLQPTHVAGLQLFIQLFQLCPYLHTDKPSGFPQCPPVLSQHNQPANLRCLAVHQSKTLQIHRNGRFYLPHC